MARSAWQWAPAQDRWVQLVEMLWANISKFPFLVFFKMAFCNTGHQDCEHGCKISVISLAGSDEGSLQLWSSSVVHSPTDCFFFSWCASSTTKSDTPPPFIPCFVTKVLLYDLRSSQPLLVKDHFYNLPIKSLNFHNQLELVVSADSKIIKMWNKETVSLSQRGTCVAPFIAKYLNFSCHLTVNCEMVTDWFWRC